MSTAIRLVKCPRCRKILPELPNIPVYKCGGCGVVLQAKRKKYDIKGNDLRAQEPNNVQKYEPNSVPNSSSPGGDHDCSSLEPSPGSGTRGDQFDSVKPVGTSSSDDYSHSAELNYHQDEKSPLERNESGAQGERESQLDQDDVQRQSEPLMHLSEKPHDITSSELSDPIDSLHDIEGSSTEISNYAKKYDVKGNDLRVPETDRIQNYEPNSVSRTSSPRGNHDHPSLKSSPGSDTREEQFNSVKPVITNSSDGYSHSTKLNYHQDDKSSPEKTESGVQGEREGLSDQDDAQQNSSPLMHLSEKPHDRTSGELSDSCDSSHDIEDSSTEIRNYAKTYDVKGSDLRVQETSRIQNYEPNSVSRSSSPGGDPYVESSPGSDTRGEQINSANPVNTNSSNDYSQSTELNYLLDDKLSQEENESEVQGERECLLELDQYAGQHTGESLMNSDEQLKNRTLKELSDSCDSLHDSEGSSTVIGNFGKKYDIKGNDLKVQETDHIQKHEPKSVLSSSSPGGDNPFVEFSPGSDTRGEQFNSVQPDNTNSSDDYSHSTELNYLQDDKLSPEENESEVQAERERLLNQDAGQHTDESLIHSSEQPNDRTFGELPDSCDSSHENKHSSTGFSNSRKKYEEGDLPKLNVVTSVNVLEDSHGVLAYDGTSAGEPKSLDESETTHSPKGEPLKLGVTKVQQNTENGIERNSNDIENGIERKSNDFENLQDELENHNELQSLDERATHSSPNEPLKLDEENEPSSEDGEHIKVDERRNLSSENERMRPNEFPDHIVEYAQKRETANESSSISMKGKEITAARGPLVKRSVFMPLTIDDEYLKGFQEVGPSFHRISSEETLDTLPINPRVLRGSMSKSPTRIYYAGDESESSFDGTEGLSAQVSHVKKFKGTGTATTNRLRKKDGFRNKNKQNDELHVHNEQLDLSSKLKQPNNISGLELPEQRKHSHPMKTSTIAANNEPVSRGSYMPRSSQLFHGNSSPASSTHSVFLHNGEFRGPDTMADSDPEKVELLRMVRELEDKINHRHVAKQMSGEMLRTGGYYDDLTTGKYSGQQRSHSQGLGWENQHRSHSQGLGWENQHRSSRQAFSGEVSLCRNHIDCRCSHCYHQSLHFSRKLSSHCIHCQHEAYNSYPSHSPSPQRYTSSEYSREMQADNRKHEKEMKMSYLRGRNEKHKVMKRHIRPACGGAPIINCYHCSELLQIPADFLLFRRRCHQLRCKACNRILKFSLLEKSHLVPYVIKIQAPPPNEVVKRRTTASTSHANNPQAAEPVSFSDKFEPSLSRNGSDESGPSVPTSQSLLKNLSKGKLPSNQTFQAMNYRRAKTFMEIYQDKNKNSSINVEAAGPSSSTSTWVKPSSEIQELHATSGSPLHRLMGYASPRQVLFAKSDDDSDDGMGFYMDQHYR